MASLSKEMRDKRDIKRTPSLLIIDKDMGNMGLYKSILANEYEMDNVFDMENAEARLEQKEYDAIILDDDFPENDLLSFIVKVKEKDRSQVICLITDKGYDVFVMTALCRGLNGLINKPFTRDGISNVLYEELKKKREMYVKKHILIVDEDIDNLKNMKAQLENDYFVTTMNCCEMGRKFIQKHSPNLVIADASLAQSSNVEMCEQLEKNKNEKGVSLLFMTDNPNEECVTRCAQFKPEGFIVKPIPMEQLLSHVERIFLVDTYSRGRN